MSSLFAAPTTEDQAAAYRALRARVRELCEAASPADLERACALTPGWRARDVLAHLVGVPNDVLAGRMDGVATDPWTQAQVDARREVAIDEMLDGWDADGDAIEAIMGAFPPQALGQMIFDATTHEHDLRHALGACGAHDTDAVRNSFEWAVRVGGAARTVPLRLRTEHGDDVLGAGDPVATVAVSPFEFVRAATGRRSAAQIARYDWDGTPQQPESLLLAPIFRLAPADVDETPR